MSKHAFPVRSFASVIPSIVVRGDGARSPFDSVKAGGARRFSVTRGQGKSARTRTEPSDIHPDEPSEPDEFNQALLAEMKTVHALAKHHVKTLTMERVRLAAVASGAVLPTLRAPSGRIKQSWTEKCKAQNRSIEPARATPKPSGYDAHKLSQNYTARPASSAATWDGGAGKSATARHAALAEYLGDRAIVAVRAKRPDIAYAEARRAFRAGMMALVHVFASAI